MKTQRRIAIVGAGPAGLATAYYLAEAGYTRVSVFEQEDQVGGKCQTLEVDGRPLELGAILISPYYKHVLPVLEKLGIPLHPAPQAVAVDPRTGHRRPLGSLDDPTLTEAKKARYQTTAMMYLLALRKARKHVEAAGYRNIPEELAMPFAQWARKNDMAELLDFFVYPVTTFGYGSLEYTPTAYVLKCVGKESFLSAGAADPQWPAILTTGYQGFIRRLAATLPGIHTGARVTRALRGEGGVELTVHTEAGEQRLDFDDVVVARPLEVEGLGFLELTERERALFSQVKHMDYWTTGCRIEGIPPAVSMAMVLDGAQVVEPTPGGPCLIARPWPDSGGCIAYTWARPDQDQQAVEQALRDALPPIGGRLVEIFETRRWRYFPHVDSATMAAGFFDQIEAMQGTHHTYYTGGQLDFDIVQGAFAHAHHLVQTHFKA